MSNKMLIDASHPEETRVAVVRGNRIEEFDFESQEKKQLRGNIYLAKVTRVEPSLQAAFIDYGGNRHGFLAFSEIHPDYYQIPVADRQALLEAEAEEARASREVEDAADEQLIADQETKEEKPKRKSRRRSPRKSAASEETNTESAEEQSVEAEPEKEVTEDSSSESEVQAEAIASENTDDAADSPEAVSDTSEEEATAKPKRRTTRRKTKKAAEAAEDEAPENPEDGDDDAGEPTTMAAMVETDSISEPLPEDGDDDNGEQPEPSEETEVTAAEETTEEKPKKRRAPRTRRKKVEPVAEETEAVETSNEANSSESDDKPVSDDAQGAPEAEAEADAEVKTDAEEEKPVKPRRRSRRKKQPVQETAEEESGPIKGKNQEADENGDTDETEDEDVESVGQDDALEEAASPRKIRRQYKIQEVIKRRQILLVQVVKEERGNKGAALTTYLSLAGRYSVLMPNTARGGGISRKITNTADRKRLKAIATELDVPEGMGVILRTAGAARTKVEIERDFQYLMRLWEQVRSLTLSSTAPCLVYEEGSLIKRSIRDLYDKDTGEVVVSGERGYKEACEFMGMLMPSRVKKVKLYKDSQAIFAKHGVETQLDNLVSPQVTLKSGGYLIINQTEALVAVDVNSGRATREHSIENTALQTNLEAAEEVARQLRLRDLAGLVVIDFIDMEERRNNRSVEKKLKDCLKNDRARIQVGRISHFGLLEMSRQRIRASVLESTMDVCAHCGGLGHVRSESAIALHVFRALEEHVSRHKRWDAVVRTTPAIATHVLNHKRASLLELEKKFGIAIMVIGDASLHGQQFEIEKGDRAKPMKSNAAIGYEGDNPSDDTENAASEEEGRGRKRGRRRNQRDKKVQEASASEADVELEEQTSLDSSPEANEDSDDAPRKKRRRGNRGGRRRKAGADDTEAENETSLVEADAQQEAGTEPDTVPDTPASEIEEAVSEEVLEAQPEPAEEKPVRRSTRRKKAPVSAKPVEEKQEEDKEPDAAEAVAASEPPRPKRRTTRRKPVEEKATEMTASVETEASDVKAELPSEATPVEAQADIAEKPKRSGWWSKGGGFF
ncbi:MAG: Rne/Rng family ribonuclease [Pseudomonadota bacterium]